MTERRDDASGVVERLEFVSGPSGPLYTWTGVAPGSRRLLVVCSSLCADFVANYHRERLLAHALVARGTSVVRFHYFGEGNSAGETSALTYPSMCADTEAVVAHGRQVTGGSELAFLGTRLGGLVAAKAAAGVPDAPIALWEPPADPMTFFSQGGRAKRMSQVAQEASPRLSWRDELRERGVLDLLGYEVYGPLVDSFEDLRLAPLLAGRRGPLFVARFRGGGEDDPVVRELRQAGLAVDAGAYEIPETWWFHDENAHDASDLVHATAAWIGDAFERVEVSCG